MEASSKAVFFSVCSYFEQSKLLCPFPRPCSRHALEVLFAVGLRHSLKLSLLYYWIADVQNLQGPDPRPGWERGEARLCPGSRPGARCESRGADCSPFERTLHNSSPSHGVGIRVAEDENGPGGGGVATLVSSAWPSGWPLSEVTNLLRRRYNLLRQSANVETH